MLDHSQRAIEYWTLSIASRGNKHYGVNRRKRPLGGRDVKRFIFNNFYKPLGADTPRAEFSKMVTNATAAYTQSNATDQPSSNCADSIRLFSGSEKGLQRFYHASYRRYEDGRSSMVFECLYNYHHIEGDLEMFCIHNEFVGREPLCEIDPYMSKIYLVPFIAFVSFIFPAIWLVADFANFTRHRRQSRTIRFQHISKRGRIKGVNIQTDLTEFHRHPSSTSVDRFASLQASYVDLHFNEFEDDEDIFINKTTRRQVSRIQHGNKEFELLGAARAFGKLGKMMEKNFF